MRELKALEIAARSKITFEAGAWLVPSQKHLAPIMFEIDADYLKQPLNSEIAVVVPATKIREALKQPVLEEARQAEIARRKADDATTID